jgi:hypothetical protein
MSGTSQNFVCHTTQITTYLRAESGESQTKRRRNTRTTRRTTRVLVRVVGSFSLSTVCRPSISAVVRAVVGPLREIGLAQNDSTSFSQLSSQSGIMRNLCAEQSERSSCKITSDKSSLYYEAHHSPVLFIWSAVAMLFLIRIGRPWRGPRMVPLARIASNSAAIARASGLSSVTM